MRHFVVGLAFLAAVWCPGSARAQTAASEAEARALFEAGRDAFATGSYDDALRDFQRAYELSRRPELLYNIGSAAERLARDEEALEAYRGFIAVLPEHASRAEVDRRIVVLEARLRARAAEPRPTPPVAAETVVDTRPAPAPAPARGGWLFSWVGLGATALAAGAAGLSWALANDAYASLEQSCYPMGCSEQEIASSDVQARLDATTAMLVVTGVLAAATIVLFVIEAPTGGPSDEPASAMVRAGPGRLELQGTF